MAILGLLGGISGLFNTKSDLKETCFYCQMTSFSQTKWVGIDQSYFKQKEIKTYSEVTSTEGVKTIYGFTKYSSEELIKEYKNSNKV